MKYNKESLIGSNMVRKERGPQTGSSPRDIQNRIRQRAQQPAYGDGLVTELNLKIERLESALAERSSQVVEKIGYTKEEFDAELLVVLESELGKYTSKIKLLEKQAVDNNGVVSSLNNKLTSLLTEVLVLKTQLEAANTRISDKDSVIEDLKARQIQAVSTEPEFVDPERPIMDTVVIDPNDADAVGKLEDNISIEDVSITEKIAMSDKVNKLKSLLGGLKT